MIHLLLRHPNCYICYRGALLVATFEVTVYVLQGITVGGHLCYREFFLVAILKIDLLRLVATSVIKCVAGRCCWWPPP